MIMQRPRSHQLGSTIGFHQPNDFQASWLCAMLSPGASSKQERPWFRPPERSIMIDLFGVPGTSYTEVFHLPHSISEIQLAHLVHQFVLFTRYIGHLQNGPLVTCKHNQTLKFFDRVNGDSLRENLLRHEVSQHLVCALREIYWANKMSVENLTSKLACGKVAFSAPDCLHLYWKWH